MNAPVLERSPIAAWELSLDEAALKTWLLEEERRAFTGWDFSYLDQRWESETEPWSYREFVLKHLGPQDQLLDMGTGGGEFLLSLGHPPQLCSVTEGYPPNLALCQQTLEPLGITVKAVAEDDRLDFSDRSFDLVLNRHESYDLNEVFRVLKPGGLFITQQVGGLNDADLVLKVRGSYESSFPNHDLQHAIQAAQAAGLLLLDSAEYRGPIRFFDLGALVYFAKIAPWEFDSFSVETDFNRLLALRSELAESSAITGTEERFFLLAQKPLP